jgi:hypothetical protein
MIPSAYAPTLVRLLQGPLYADAGAPWDLLLRHRQAVEEYFAHMALEVVVAEHDGLAFLRKRRYVEGEETPEVPELTVRRELPYLASLLSVLLVEALYRFEASGGDQARLVMSKDGIRELIAPYLPARSNEARQSDSVEAQINNLIRYGFLRKMRGDDDALEVTRLLKYKIDADRIQELKERLAAHAGSDTE